MRNNDFTILVAEDDPGVRRIYEKALGMEGYQLILAESGARALAELEENQVDLMITDLKMENMSALEMLPVVNRKFPNLPVIVASGYYKDIQQDFLAKGFKIKAFLQKPVCMLVLKEEVQNALAPSMVEKKRMFRISSLA
jgi:CheY-like chemotaxis protein